MRATLSSIPFMANWKTQLVHFILLPLINTAVLMLVDFQFRQSFSWDVPVAAALVSGALLAVNALTASFTTDRNLKIDCEMLASAPFSVYYWGVKFCAAGLLSLVLTLIQLSLLWLISGGAAPVWAAVCLAPHMVLAGLAVGFVSAVGAWRLADPYRISNLVCTFGYLLSGALVVLEEYPLWLQVPAKLLPFAHILAELPSKSWMPQEITTLAWVAIGALVYLLQVHTLRKKAGIAAFG